MPIYAYKCESCGFAKDVLQKISDQALTECPSCGASGFKKQLTAAGFQLKGSGWYATDFKGSGAAPAATGAEPAAKTDAGGATAGGAAGTAEGASPAPAPTAVPAAAATAAPAAPGT
jgi:putative FmdB family regulatory protein